MGEIIQSKEKGKYTIFDGEGKEGDVNYTLGYFNTPLEAIENLNAGFANDCYRPWLKNGKAVLKNFGTNTARDAKPIANFNIKIENKGKERIARIEP